MDNKTSWLGGWDSQWCPPQGLSEHKHHDNAATTVIRTARTLEAEWWQVCGEACVRGKRKMNQVLGAFGLLYLTMLGPVLAWCAFLNLWTFISLIFQILFGPRPAADN
jgi:nitrate reductase NapE component